MTRPMLLAFMAAVFFAATGVQAQTTPAEDFTALRDRYWQWSLDNNPALARRVGDARGASKLSDLSLAHMDALAQDAEAMAQKLKAIPLDQLPADMATDAVIIGKLLHATRTAQRFGQRAILFDSYSSWEQELIAEARESSYTSRADFIHYIDRLLAFPAQAAAAQATTKWALAHGYVQPCIVVARYPQSLAALIRPDVADTVFAKPFAQKPAALSAAHWAELKARGMAAIKNQVLPALTRYQKFIVTDYMPRCRASTSISATPQGAAYYQWRIAEETTTSLGAEEIHAIGLSEVARITAEMDKVAASAGYAGQRAAYIAELRQNPKYYAKSAEELLSASARVAKFIDGQLPRLFNQLPRLPYGVKAIPDEIADGNTTAYYEPGAWAQHRAAIYRVNTTHLDQRPLFEIPALSAHEAVPGHHLQIALQQEQTLSPIRSHLTHYTAYVEGWALYAESLGLDMGLYDTPEKNMGRLSYEMWRACRLVVDTGLHAKGWSRAQAKAYMKAHTALSDANIDAEVTRYIGWPAQALGYKLGELSITAQRRAAEAALGENFDLRAFHDQLLARGPLPLDMVESHTQAWIAAQKLKP